MSFLDPTSEWYSVSVSVIIHVISYNIGQCYNNTRLYSNFSDVIISVMFSQITSVTIVYSTVCSGTDQTQRKHQSSASLTFVRGIHWWPVNSPHKGPVTWKRFPFDDIIMYWILLTESIIYASLLCLYQWQWSISCYKQHNQFHQHII